MSSIWVSDVQSKIYSKVKAMLTAKLIKKYPSLYITDNDEVPTTPKFPSIYIEFLQPSEIGQDLSGDTINGIQLTVEVKVTSTEAQGMNVAREVAYTVLDVFKQLRFNSTMPNFENDGSGTKTMIARYSRVIGAKDTF